MAESLRVAAAIRHLGGMDEMEPIFAPVSLAERLRALPSELQRIVGKVALPEDYGEAIIDALRQGGYCIWCK